MSFDTFIGTFEYKGKKYKCITTNKEVKFDECDRGNFGLRTASMDVAKALFEIFDKEVEFTIDLESDAAQVRVERCRLYKYSPHETSPFPLSIMVEVNVEGFLVPDFFTKEKVLLT